MGESKMNTKVLLTLVVLMSTLYGFSQRGVRIGYVDMEYILENVEEYREASEQLNAKAAKWKQEIELKQSVIEQMKKDLMAEKVLLTDELIAEREEEIQILEKEMLDYQQDRFGPQGDLVLQKQLLVQPIQDQVFNEVQKIGANKRHDISDLVLREIARTRKVSASNKKQDQKNRLEQFKADEEEADEEISAALQERQERTDSIQQANTKAAEDRRAEQLKLREERKKAYEARRQKL